MVSQTKNKDCINRILDRYKDRYICINLKDDDGMSFDGFLSDYDNSFLALKISDFETEYFGQEMVLLPIDDIQSIGIHHKDTYDKHKANFERWQEMKDKDESFICDKCKNDRVEIS